MLRAYGLGLRLVVWGLRTQDLRHNKYKCLRAHCRAIRVLVHRSPASGGRVPRSYILHCCWTLRT